MFVAVGDRTDRFLGFRFRLHPRLYRFVVVGDRTDRVLSRARLHPQVRPDGTFPTTNAGSQNVAPPCLAFATVVRCEKPVLNLPLLTRGLLHYRPKPALFSEIKPRLSVFP